MYTKEIEALRLYEGDTRIRDGDGELIFMESADPFYNDRYAYRTLNPLLFPGISSEYSRIELEKNQLNIIFFERIEQTIQLFCDMFWLMCTYRSEHRTGEIIAKRIDRHSALSQYEKGRTASFVSASKAKYDKEFAISKNGVILLEVHLNQNVPYLDFETVLGKDYRYHSEREVLLPPFINVLVKEVSMTITEKKRYRDMKDHQPLGKYQIHTIELEDFAKESMISASKEAMAINICQKSDIGMDAIAAMNRGEWEYDFSDYVAWKEDLQFYLKVVLSDMWYRGWKI